MKGKGLIRARLGQSINSTIWCVFLGLLVTASFLRDFYDSWQWMLFTCVFYVLCIVHILACLGGVKYNRRAIRAAKPILVLLGVSYALVWCQTWMPNGNVLRDALLANPVERISTELAWFQPDLVWSVVPDKTQVLLMSELLIGLFFLMSLSLVTTKHRLLQLLTVVSLAAFLHAVVGIAAKYGDLILVDAEQIDGHFNAARGWFVNRNHFASFISLGLCGAIALQLRFLIKSRDVGIHIILIRQLTSLHWLSFSCLITGLLAMLISQSRAGFFALFMSLLLLMWLSGKLFSAVRKRWSVLLFGALGLTVLLLYFGGDLLSRVDQDIFSVGERGQQWRITFAAIRHEWLLGYGGNSYATVFQFFRGYDDLRPLIYNQAHNDFLHIWLEQGLLGLCLWLAILIVVLKRALTLYKATLDPTIKSTVFACFVVLLAAVMQSFFDFNLQIPSIRLYFFVIMSMVFTAPSIKYRVARKRRREIKPNNRV